LVHIVPAGHGLVAVQDNGRHVPFAPQVRLALLHVLTLAEPWQQASPALPQVPHPAVPG
jgi:hypothetical protein